MGIWKPVSLQIIIHKIEVNHGIHIDKTHSAAKHKNRPGRYAFKSTRSDGFRRYEEIQAHAALAHKGRHQIGGTLDFVELLGKLDQLLVRQLAPVHNAFEGFDGKRMAGHTNEMRNGRGFLRERSSDAEAGQYRVDRRR